MAKSDEIARLIPLYRQFIAEQRSQEQRQADRLKQRQTKRSAAHPSPDNEPPLTEPPPDTAVLPNDFLTAKEVTNEETDPVF